jgi:hypothetical protein
METDELFELLRAFGFVHFDIAVDDKDNSNGPGIIFMARR